MRFLMILLAGAGTLMLAGCDSPALISMEPAVTEQGAMFDASLLGTWETERGGDLCILRVGRTRLVGGGQSLFWNWKRRGPGYPF